MLMRCKTLWRVLPAFQHTCYSSSTLVGVNPAVVVAATASNISSNDNVIPKATEIQVKESADDMSQVTKSKQLVSAVFDSLKDANIEMEMDEKFDLIVSSATSADDLLSASTSKNISTNHALKIVSKLADWLSEGKVKLVEFEGDPRFTKLCRKLGHKVSNKPFKPPVNPNKSNISAVNDLNVVLGVAGDDEAAKLIDTITVPQMIKVLLSLAYKKRRSTPLLRSLAFNIGKSSDSINIKDCADVLYSCFQLSFIDEVLFEKISSELYQSIKTNNKPAVIGSIITSLGCLKYKDTELLNLISEWVVQNFNVCRTQDLVSLILTLGTVNYIPTNGGKLFKKLETHIQQSDVAAPNIWVDVVASLVILNKATESQILSVLNENFIDHLVSLFPDGLSPIMKVKLLNINSAAKLLLKDYKGSLLESDSHIADVQVPRSKEKQMLVTAVIDTLTNLVPSANYMNTNINTGMGFIIDAELIMDENLNALPFVHKITGKTIDRSKPGAKQGTKISVIVLDYHDITRGQRDPIGIASLAINLMEKSGYKVITVPYYDFNPRDKLVVRVKYLEQKLKTLFNKSSSSNPSVPS